MRIDQVLAKGFAGILVLCTIGCSMERADVEQKDQDLVIAGHYLWNIDDFPLSVCFRPEGDGTSADRQLVRDSVDASWPTAEGSAISFTGWGTCTSSEADIRIFLHSSISRSVSAVGTVFHNPVELMQLALPATIVADSMSPQFVYMHEFGHALGILHEQTHNMTPTDCLNQLAPADKQREGDAVDITSYDAASVMNYCGPEVPRLSDRDELFAQLFYPGPLAQFSIACKSGCIRGESVFLRNDGVAQDEFSARGASSWWETNGGFAMSWWAHTDAQEVGAASELLASTLQSEVQYVDYAARVKMAGVAPDASDERWIVGLDEVIVSDSRWTSVVSSLF